MSLLGDQVQGCCISLAGDCLGAPPFGSGEESLCSIVLFMASEFASTSRISRIAHRPAASSVTLALVLTSLSGCSGSSAPRDTTPPTLSIESHIDGEVIQGVGSVTLSGSVADDVQLESLTASVDAGAFANVPVSSGAFSYLVPVELAETEVVLRALDMAGNAAEVALSLHKTAEGLLDTTYGQDVLPADGTPDGFTFSDRANNNDSIRDGVMDSLGRSLACGLSRGVAGNFDFIVWRYTEDGLPDTSFGPDVEPVDGTPDGFVTLDSPAGGTNSDDWAQEMAIDADGNILVVGYGTGFTTGVDMVLARFTVDGILDTTFGGDINPADGAPDGFVTYSSAGTDADQGLGLTLDASGNIFVVGNTASTTELSCAIWKFDASGTLDSSFGGGNGFVFVSESQASGADDIGNAVRIDPAGCIVVSGSSDGAPTVWRFTSAGALDTTFGVDINPADGAPDGFYLDAAMAGGVMDDLKVQPNGTILGTGNYHVDATNRRDMVLFRLTADGLPDLTFGSDYDMTPGPDGYVRHHAAAGNPNADGGKELVLDAAGNILIAGESEGPSFSAYMTVWRFTQDGVLDTTFGDDKNPVDGVPDGFIFDAGPSNNLNLNQGESIYLDAHGRPCIAGTTFSASLGGANCVVWRLR